MTSARWPCYVSAVLGFVWFLTIGGGPTLNPVNIGWLLSGDWLQHWLGWLFFRHEAWTFPVGTLSALPYPIGTTIGFTDSNPLVSLLLKPFSGLLPAEFQFIGPWLALCFVMQGYMGAALAGTVTRNSAQQLLGGCLFVLSPALAARLGHDTLCAHWLLLGLMYLGLREYADATRARRASWLATGLVMLAASIHPYLAAMCFVLAMAGHARLWRSRLMTPGRAALAALATTAAMLTVFGVIGYFGVARINTGGFGIYSSDLLTLIDPRDSSRLLPGLPLPPPRWEGLGFVGLGGMLAAAIAGVAFARGRPPRRTGTWIVAVACGLMGVYALSSDITVAGHRLAHVQRFYDLFPTITGTFRASGRFIWPLHYLVLLFGIWGTTRVSRSARPPAGTALLAMVVVLQAADLRVDSWWSSQKQFRRVSGAGLSVAAGHYRHLAVFPMQVIGACGETYDEDHVYRFMLEAYRLGTTYNSGNFARLSVPRVQAECERLEREVDAGTLDPQTIYVVWPTHVPRFKAAGAACGRFDGDWICVSRDSDEVFRTYVETGKVIARSPGA